METRGIRNNNPVNLRRGQDWQGLVRPHMRTDKEFCQFISIDYGLRAAIITLKTYCSRYGLDTVAKIIQRWAPPTENATNEYISFVCKEMKVEPDERLNLFEFKAWRAKFIAEPTDQTYELLRAMCKMESGYELSYDVYDTALMLYRGG